MGKEKSVAIALSEAFKENKSLLHVDISNCNFWGEEIEIINKGLSDNHTILGIHLLGNMGTTDTLGYVHKSEEIDCAMWSIFTRIKPTLERGVKHNSKAISLHAASNCWICEGWTEVKFEIIPDKIFSEKHDSYTPIYLHISSDKFEEDLLLPEEGRPGVYSSTRMIPPGNISYYFTKENLSCVDPNQPKDTIFRSSDEFINVPQTNILQNVIAENTPITETIIQNMKWYPRPPPKALTQRTRVKTPWSWFKSVFKDYRRDTQQILDDWFDYDWPMWKIPRVI